MRGHHALVFGLGVTAGALLTAALGPSPSHPTGHLPAWAEWIAVGACVLAAVVIACGVVRAEVRFHRHMRALDRQAEARERDALARIEARDAVVSGVFAMALNKDRHREVH